MTPEQLQSLAGLAKTIEALEAVADEWDALRNVMARLSGNQRPEYPPAATLSAVARQYPAAPIHQPVSPGHAALATPERLEYEAAKAVGATVDVPPEEMTPGQAARAARAAYLASMRASPQRAQALAGYEGNGHVEEA